MNVIIFPQSQLNTCFEDVLHVTKIDRRTGSILQPCTWLFQKKTHKAADDGLKHVPVAIAKLLFFSVRLNRTGDCSCKAANQRHQTTSDAEFRVLVSPWHDTISKVAMSLLTIIAFNAATATITRFRILLSYSDTYHSRLT